MQPKILSPETDDERRARLRITRPTEMTADDLTWWRDEWRAGRMEKWRATTSRPSTVDRSRTVDSDHEAPTAELCVYACNRALQGVYGAFLKRAPYPVRFVKLTKDGG